MHNKSITELCDLDSSSQIKMPNFNTITPSLAYNNFVVKEIQPQKKITSKRYLLVRSTNVSPSVGQYEPHYESLQKHQFQVRISQQKSASTTQLHERQQSYFAHVSKQASGQSIDFNKQISREQMYQTKGWFRYDKSMARKEKSMQEKIEELKFTQQVSKKYPPLSRGKNFDIPITYLPITAEKLQQIGQLYQNKYKIKKK